MADAPKPANPFGPFDVSDFTPGTTTKRPHAPLAMVREVAEANNYPSRATPRPPRSRRKTGRTEQLNLRVRAEDLARFVEISDEFNWVFGETFQHLIETFDKTVAGQQPATEQRLDGEPD
jgi:hypothetical protein